jgi:hypothetical protein
LAGFDSLESLDTVSVAGAETSVVAGAVEEADVDELILMYFVT